MTGKHLFVSAGGQLLPSWQQAFPAARASVLASSIPVSAPETVWLRLSPQTPVAEQLGQLRQRLGTAANVIVLSNVPDDEQAMQAFASGAKGYCNSHAAPEVLRLVAATVAQGGLWVGESLMQRMLRSVSALSVAEAQDRSSVSSWQRKLTERERQIAGSVARGASNKEIAREFDITERTVKAHVSAILDKLAVQDRLQLALLVTGRRQG